MSDESATARRPGAARFEEFSQYVSTLQTVEPLDGDVSAFDWHARLHALGPASFSRARVSRHVSRRTPGFCAQAGLDHVIVYYRLAGTGVLQTEAAARLTRPGDITFMDMSRPMSATGPIDTICLGLPRTLIAPLVADVDGLHGLGLPRDTALGRLAASHLTALAAEIDGMDAAEARIVAGATAQLLAACASASPVVSEEARVRARPALLVTIRHHIETHLAERTLGAATIAHHFALSRSTLFRLFHPFGGIEVYIRRRRLARAYQALTDASVRSGDYIYQVALSLGFASASAFARAFRTEFGATPRDVAHGAGGMPASTAYATDLTQCLHDMVFQGT